MNEEKVTIGDKMPRVTEEMIAAVKAHERAEYERSREESNRKHREWMQRLNTETLDKIRKIFPGADKEQFEDLYCIFSDYFEAIR